jgi:UDP-N-acetylglucosamine/UDP-N-acetylgalactosamine diphosphorylase
MEIVMADITSVRQMLQKFSQQHLVQFYDELQPGAQAALLEQINTIDFGYMNELIGQYVKNSPSLDIGGKIEPPEIVLPGAAQDSASAELVAAGKKGEELIAAGKVAAFVVAGGQGTRLGYPGPKGCLEATPITRKPLFRVFAEQILAASRRGKAPIPWYIMTSPANDVVTKAFFRQNDFFGLSARDVFFMVQGTMPAISMDGKILLAGKGDIALSPNGHGGALLAMQTSGALADMARRGVEYISYFQVDNPLVKCVDPLFVGLHAMRGAEMSAKCLPKRDPMERLGNLCKVDGKTTVIEYSDMPDELARACNSDGRLKFSAGSIAIHILSRAFVERLTADGKCSLPLHRAVKAVPYIDDKGELAKPQSPNAVKLEMFVFDALPLASSAVILQTQRSEEFSPVKNASGEDSLATSLHAQVRRAASWLESAGIVVPRDADGQIAAPIEISPLYADSAQEVAAKVDRNMKITPGQSVYLGSRGQTGGAR